MDLLGPETDLEGAVFDAEVVHLHGLWQGHTRRGARAARRSGVPYVMTAHGHAEPWALRHKAWKKRAYAMLVEGKNLRRAACLHALSRPEIGHLRALAPKAPVCFVPNGVDLRPFDDLPPRSGLEAEFPELVGQVRRPLSDGRLHAKKGLDPAGGGRWGRVLKGDHPGAPRPRSPATTTGRSRRSWRGWRPAGPLRPGHAGSATSRARGPAMVWAAADAFALPSYSEGFSMAILEALACRLPCRDHDRLPLPRARPSAERRDRRRADDGRGDGRAPRVWPERSEGERAGLGQPGSRALVEARLHVGPPGRPAGLGLPTGSAGGGATPEAVADAEL